MMNSLGLRIEPYGVPTVVLTGFAQQLSVHPLPRSLMAILVPLSRFLCASMSWLEKPFSAIFLSSF